MHNHNYRRSGFTIVELLVVIVVIGILAAVTIVSYTGISQRATIASLQTDLSTSAQQLKMYYTDNGTYPQSLDTNNCPQDPADPRYCLKKSSSDTTYLYSSSDPWNTFSLTGTRAGKTYVVTESTAPTPPPATFNLGGSIVDSGGTRTHTFGLAGSPHTITASAVGTIAITINGAGGGGGGWAGGCGSADPGLIGANTTIATGGGTWYAYPGFGGTATYGDCDTSQTTGTPGADGGTGVQGSATLTGWTSTSNGSAGGASIDGPGGKGGKLVGSLSISNGQQVVITIGAGGAGGSVYDGSSTAGTAGTAGGVIISYPYSP